MPNVEIIFVAGPQGSGKGTQGKKLADKLGFFFWEMGKILREIGKEDTALAVQVRAMNQGTLLTDETIIEVLKQRLPFVLQGGGVIFDGVPRRDVQAKFLIEYLREAGKREMATVFIDVPREESMRRLILRAKHEERVDDTPEGIETRFRYYDEAMAPTIEYLKKETKFITVDGLRSVDELAADIERQLGLD